MRCWVQVIIMVVVINALQGCTVPSPKRYWDKAVDFRDYAEQVFRRQNQINSEILMLLDEDVDDSESYAKLIEAEQNLQEQCQLLNEYAVRERDGVEITLLFKQKVQASVDDCETAMQEADLLLGGLVDEGSPQQ